MHPPRLIGNTGEVGEFVLPLNVADKSGRMQQFDDFTFAAASWTLTAHEARPGHELQFASIVEQGVSDARITFAFNSTNVEGWGLYAEWLIEPFEPAEGRLICLQHRLVRAARAFLDIELQTGKITREQALATLKNDVVVSDTMANQEVERYTFRAPGQANAYFYGLHSLARAARRSRKGDGQPIPTQGFSRLHPRTRAVAASPAEEGGARGISWASRRRRRCSDQQHFPNGANPVEFNRFDVSAKELIWDDPANWLERLSIGPRGPTVVIDSDITALTAAADKVIHVGGAQPYLVNFEVQSSYQAGPGRDHLVPPGRTVPSPPTTGAHGSGIVAPRGELTWVDGTF